MANIKKSFNFVDGLQVDFDSFVVNSVGNVGVGTSSPSVYLFNVYGDSRVTGLTTTGALSVSGVSTFASDVKIGSAVTITSSTGIVSATSYYGDGSNLTGVFGIATQGWILVNGNTGLSTTLNVGIGTTQTNTEYDLIVGTGISFAGDSGNAVYTGIITSSELDTTQIDSTNILVSGIATLTNIDSGNLKSTGISTLGVTTVTNLTAQQLSVSGLSTFSGIVSFASTVTAPVLHIEGGSFNAGFDNFTDAAIVIDEESAIYTKDSDRLRNLIQKKSDVIIIGQHNTSLIDGIDLKPGATGGQVKLHSGGTTDNVKLETTGAGVTVFGTTESQQLNVSGVSTFSNDILIGTGATVGFGSTAYFKDNAGIFLGDEEDLRIFHDGTESFIHDNGTGGLVFLTGSSSIEFRRNSIPSEKMLLATPGDSVELYYNNSKKFETTNTGVNISGIGSFDSIGIQTSAPSTDLQIRKASGNATLEVISDTGKSSISIGNSVGAGTSSASINYGSVAGFGAYSTNQSFNIINRDTGNVNYFLSNNAASDSGFRWHKSITPLMTLNVDGNLGIGETNPAHKLHVQGISTFTAAAHFDSSITSGSFVKSGGTSSQFLMADGSVNPGNFTGNLSGNVNTTTGISTFNDVRATTVGVGTTNPRCALDLSEAQDDDTGFVLFPSKSTTQRNSISPLIEGAIIYNNENKRLELYNGTGWVGIATEA